MCLLCVIEPNKTPTKRQLMTASANNPDGFGYAFHCGDRIITGRGMDAEEVVDRFLRIREGLPHTWAMFHARYTTHGETNKSNCHPFRMNGDPSTVIGHNGIIPITVEKGDHRSDTRIFADEWLPHLITLLDDEKGFEEMETLIGGSKVAVFTHDPRLSNQVYILNEHLGHWSDGIWWSNSTYKTQPFSYYKSVRGETWWDSPGGCEYPSLWKDLDKEPIRDNLCELCFQPLSELDFKVGSCGKCKHCIDCFEHTDQCLCYTPTYGLKKVYEGDKYGSVTEIGSWSNSSGSRDDASLFRDYPAY